MSKTKAETEVFFKLIMSFERPRPRNIEKDVKVFKWREFGPALVKSIAKYVSTKPLLASSHQKEVGTLTLTILPTADRQCGPHCHPLRWKSVGSSFLQRSFSRISSYPFPFFDSHTIESLSVLFLHSVPLL